MAVRLIPLNDRVLKDDGAPASDGSYKFYLAGSTTPVTVYSDRGLTSSLGSSVPIDAEGYPTYVNVWGADDVSYKIGIQATGYNDGAEKFFDYAAVATSAVVDNSDATPAFKNLLNNGGPSNWTGGTSFSNISGSAAAVEIADDWFFSQNGTASNAISRQTGDGQTARYAMRVGRPAASVSVETLRVYQALPTDNAYQCRGKTITVSFSLKKGADFSGGSVGVLIATGTTEGESGNLMATGGWGGFASALSTTQAPSTTSTRYQFSAALPSNIKEAGLQLSYTPTGTAGSNDWVQIEDVQWEIASAATDYAAIPEVLEYIRSNLSAFGRTLIDDANAAAALTTLGAQPLDATLTALAALTITAGTWIKGTGTDTFAVENASTTRTSLGLGTAATQNTGTSGANIPFLNGTNTWSGTNLFTSLLQGGQFNNLTGSAALLSIENTAGLAAQFMNSLNAAGDTVFIRADRTDKNLVKFNFGASTAVGTISTNGTTTAYNTSSDYRLKENIADLDGAIERVKAMRPRWFSFKSDASHTLYPGFIAHELALSQPWAVTGEKDGEQMQGVDAAKAIPDLVAVIKNLISRVEILEAR